MKFYIDYYKYNSQHFISSNNNKKEGEFVPHPHKKQKNNTFAPVMILRS